MNLKDLMIQCQDNLFKTFMGYQAQKRSLSKKESLKLSLLRIVAE